MTSKSYTILLDNMIIGTTSLEKADPPMGVVFGKIDFIDITSGYDFFKTYCLANSIEMIAEDFDERLIATAYILNLKVIDPNGIEIKGEGINVEGMDSDIYDVTIVGVPYPFFEEEFPHHVKAYNDSFNKI